MEFIVGLLSGILIISLVLIILINVAARARIKYIEQRVEEGIRAFRERVIDSKIEEHEGFLRLYNKKTDEFLGQGKDLHELNEVVMKRFPDKLFNVPQEELSKYKKVMKDA
jgi:hypothetical protein